MEVHGIELYTTTTMLISELNKQNKLHLGLIIPSSQVLAHEGNVPGAQRCQVH